MADKHGEVLWTKKYNNFTLMEHNRDVNPHHVSKIAASMKQKQYTIPIIVNEKMEVIDGQHRLAACKLVGLPVPYIIGEGYDDEDVKTINNTSKSWSVLDCIKSEASKGNEVYKQILRFMTHYEMGSSHVMELGAGYYKTKELRNGTVTIEDREVWRRNIERFVDIRERTDINLHKYHVRGLRYMFGNPDYNHRTMLKAIDKFPRKLTNVADIQDSIDMFQELYNFHKSVGKIHVTRG